MTQPQPPRRRFAPVPVETTFTSVRQANSTSKNPTGPNPELTPEPSPTSETLEPPEPRIIRRFAPQLIETSRRTRRAGDEGPATKPTDKTDITPYTNHIYTAKNKPRLGADETEDEEPQRPVPPTRRETEDEQVLEYLLELAKKEAARQIEETALAAFPNSRPREGGVAHFYYNEGSSSDNVAEEDEAAVVQKPSNKRARRKSSTNQDMSWWQQHMQEHAQQLARERGEDLTEQDEDVVMDSDSELDKMDLPAPPDPLWTTNKKVAVEDRREPLAGPFGPIGESHMPYIQPDPFVAGQRQSGAAGASSSKGAPEHEMKDAPAPSKAKDQEIPYPPYPPAFRVPPETSFQNKTPFVRPWGNLGYRPPTDSKQQQQQQKASKTVSPPMQGKDLTFRKCPSPKHTKLQPSHPFSQQQSAEEKQRDTTGQAGLWRGYCFQVEPNDEYLAPSQVNHPAMIKTPQVPGTPAEVDESAGDYLSVVSDGPSSMSSVLSSAGSALTTGATSISTAEHRGKGGQPKGVHMLHGIDERLRKEKAQAERDEKIAHEFNDEFVTQVYNYLSLGYPATARGFDEELARISRSDVDDLRRDDERQMAKGHMLEMDLGLHPEGKRCPRWRALRVYVTEWARQHPNLDNLDPLAWGVRERRGSWAI